MTQSFSMLLTILMSTLLVALLLAALVYFDLQAPLIRFLDWLQNIGLWAPLIFMGMYMLLVIFLLPSVLFTLAAGFLFGPFIGSAAVVIASTLGALNAFLISRYLFSNKVKQYLRSHKKLKIINDEFVYEGWKLILLTRLMPFFPLKLSNYFFGSSSFSLADFVMGTFLGIIPNTLFIVFVGSLAADLNVLASGELLGSQHAWFFYVVALALLIVMIIYITNRAQKALARYEARQVECVRSKHAL
jgi:uncharacterized membrane protein YdjX (TVP38/TMEM64 family)